MTRKDSFDAGRAGEEASRRFVRVDAGEPGADAELATWLAERPEHERGMERVELAVVLARRLAAEPGSALHAEAAQAARLVPPRRRFHRALVWSGAIAALLLVAIFVFRDELALEIPSEIVAIEAARTVTFDAPSNPIAVLPTGVVVDASAVAVLPFAAADNSSLGSDLERDVAAALRSVPGLYVIADGAVQPYAGTELAPSEVGELLGARGLVDASVKLVGGRVLVDARLRETATGTTLWQAQIDRPVDELRAVRDEMADGIAGVMLDPGLRAPPAIGAGSDDGVSASKPFQQ